MLNTYYNSYNYSSVVDYADFYRSPLPECLKIKAMVGAIKLLFSLPDNNIKLYVSEGDRVYKITLITQDIHKVPFGWFIYIPLENRLDLYIPDSPSIPFMQWKDKKVVLKNYPYLFDKAGLDKLFKSIVSIS